MLRLAALILLAFLLWLVLVGALRVLRRLAGAPERKGTMPRRPPMEVSGEELVRCAVCGTHVPRSRALSAPGVPVDLYCSDRCRRSSPLAS